MKGFRVPPAPSKNEKMRSVEAELQNIQMAARVSQLMTQQLMNSVKTMSDDLGSALNQLYELQYKVGALQKHFNVPAETLNQLANEQRLIDFDAASLKQDAKDNMLVVDEVGTDSTVTLTTVATDAEGTDRGIFRSRIKLADCGVPELITALNGKKVGEKVTVKLNGLDHEVELLSVRNPGPTTEVAATEEAAQEASQ